MNIELLRDYCLTKKEVEETFPFDDDTLVFKVLGKAFALISLKEPDSVNLKCDPERAIELRQTFEAVKPGYHMNKKHWNTVYFNLDLSDKELRLLIDHSYDMVVKGMPKKMQLMLSE